jgi:hypothetical protein
VKFIENDVPAPDANVPLRMTEILGLHVAGSVDAVVVFLPLPSGLPLPGGG